MGACQVAYMAIISVAEASVSIEGQTISRVALEPCEVLVLAGDSSHGDRPLLADWVCC